MTVRENQDQIERVILTFIQEQFPAASQVELTTETHLFREGVVDSIGILLLVRMLEEQFSLSVDPSQMVLANFETVRAMVAPRSVMAWAPINWPEIIVHSSKSST